MKFEVKPIAVGRSTGDLSVFTYMANVGTVIEFDLAYFLIKGAEKNIIVDSMTNADIMMKYWTGETRDVQTFEESLEKEGLTPSDIDMIILTQLHFDHIVNAPKCENAEVYVQEAEWDSARVPHPLHAQFYPQELIDQIGGMKMRLIKGSYELLPGLRLLHTPGHTPGTMSVLVDTNEGQAVIAGPCTSYYTFEVPVDLLGEDHPFRHWGAFIQGIFADLKASYSSVLLIKSRADILFPNHGPGYDRGTVKYLPAGIENRSYLPKSVRGRMGKGEKS